MRARYSAVPALLLLTAAAASAQYKSGPAGAPPAMPAALSAAIDPAGVQVTAPDGKAWCEMWFVKASIAGPKVEGEAVSLPQIPHGALLGVARFPAQATDRRGNTIKAGVYAMRYSIYPTDGNHMGAAPQRDFAVLVPVDKDKAPDVRLDYAALMALVAESTGVSHPIVLSLAPSEEKTLPVLKKEGERDWVLHVKIGGVPMALIVAGKTEG
jgi:hypothetical protein